MFTTTTSVKLNNYCTYAVIVGIFVMTANREILRNLMTDQWQNYQLDADFAEMKNEPGRLGHRYY